jgi:hypothetical protein
MEKLIELRKELKFYENQLKQAKKCKANDKIISFQEGMILNTKIKISIIKKNNLKTLIK